MKLKRSLAFLTIGMLLMLACNLSSVTTSLPTADSQAQVDQAVADTQLAQTQLALSVQQTMAALVTNTPQATYTDQPTYTLQFTYTPQPTATLNAPKVTVSVDTNCRKGPGNVYESIGALMVGQTADVVARSPYNDSWIIKLPNNPNVTCWLWAQYATVIGDTSSLPVAQIPPTPTPSLNFTVSFVDNTNCGAQYAFQFQVYNNGGILWESINITVNNLTDSTTTVHTSDHFKSYESCVVESDQDSLDPGEGGHVANISPGQLSYDPAGKQFSATVKLCTQNGLGGTCLERTINFNP